MAGNKTLDEVIDAFERQWICPSNDEAEEYCELYAVRDEAINYLKMYRSDTAQYEFDREQWETAGKEAKKAWQDAKDKYIAKLKELDIGTLNDPLTWSELKQCEGKPIWIEWYDPIDDKRGWHKAEWYLLQWCRDDEDPEWKMLYAINDEQEQCPYYLKDMGERWTAYRKERK